MEVPMKDVYRLTTICTFRIRYKELEDLKREAKKKKQTVSNTIRVNMGLPLLKMGAPKKYDRENAA
jgi:hypothetical protein